MKAIDSLRCIRYNTLHRFFSGTDFSLIAVLGTFELLHNIFDLARASEGDESCQYAIGWYERELPFAMNGDLLFRPPNKYIKGTIFKRLFLSKKKKEKLLDEAKKYYLFILEANHIIPVIQKLLEDAEKALEKTNLSQNESGK